MISLLHVSTDTETVLRKCIKTIMSSANYEKEGGCFGRMLKTRARQITKCLRNHKHPIAFEQSLHLGESREVTREPHVKGDAGSKGGGKKRPPPFSRFRCTLTRPLAINMLRIMTPVNASQNQNATYRKERGSMLA